MKVCPNCQTKYPDDANFCPQESCATEQGPRRLDMVAAEPTGRYRMADQLGGARSGEVWRAVDTQSGGTVAHKRVALASLPTPAALERAQRELKQLQRAQSQRIGKVLDFGKDPDGRLFIVTELCEGQPLDRLVAATGPLPLDRAKKIVAQIGEALLEGQKVGVVHHDLSAKNVLISDADDVKLINFVAPVAVSDTVFGVPEYLSPEQAEGKLVDQRSNTYSLAAIMTLLLSGQPPASGSDVAAVLEQITKGTVAPPSQAVAGLTPEIDRVILKAMDKSPNRRPLTMRQFLSEVSSLVGMGAAMTADANRGVGFAKTMMFTGGSPEIQKLVNQAVAARGDTNGAGAPTPPPVSPADAGATPPPTSAAPPAGARRTHGAAVAATMVALPAVGAKLPGAPASASVPSLDGAVSATPPPVAAAPEPAGAAVGAAAGSAPKQGAGGNFRETLWFKKGDVDQMVAEARARVEASRSNKGAPPAEPEAPPEDVRPLEDRYVDDGSVTTDDRKKFSLRSGGTATSLPTVGNIPGERMSDNEMMGEIGGRKRLTIIVVSVIVVLGLIVAVVVGFRGKDVKKGAAAITPEPIPTQPTAAPEPPPPPAPAPPPAKPAAAAAAADADAEEAAEAPKPKAPAAKKHAAAKKPKGKKHSK